MKKTILLFILIPLAFLQESKAQHFIASFGVQHSWNVPRVVTDQIYDHYYDFNWVHADRVFTPRGYDFHVILQRDGLFAEVEIGWDGFIRHVEYFDYYPLDQHVCDDFCGFHQPFYNTYYSSRRFVFDYGFSYVYFRPRIRPVYYHPFRYTRRARYYNVYSPFRFRRNYTRVYRRVDHYDHSYRYGRNRTFHYRGNAQRAGRSSNYRNNNAGRSSNSRTYGDRTRTTTRQNDGRQDGRQSNVNRSGDRTVNRDLNNSSTRSGSGRQSSDRSGYNNNSRTTTRSSGTRSSVGRTSNSGNSRSYTPRSNSGSSNVNRSGSSSRSTTTRTSPSRSGSRNSSSVNRNSGSRSSSSVNRSSGSRSSSSVNRSSGSRSSGNRSSGSRSSVRSGSSSSKGSVSKSRSSSSRSKSGSSSRSSSSSSRSRRN